MSLYAWLQLAPLFVGGVAAISLIVLLVVIADRRYRMDLWTETFTPQNPDVIAQEQLLLGAKDRSRA